ncbi:MAG: hypothetical protein QNJ74_11140 [Trichodesmium sp. MO_231.B1]|nr:hypothetical protein [Trichodesmium sp. MO_231.B1]
MSIRRTVEVRLVSSKELAEEFVASMDNWMGEGMALDLPNSQLITLAEKTLMMSESTRSGLKKND